MTVEKEARIAIIGAGISGIFTAIALKKRGYTNLTLYEKADRITSLTSTIEHKGLQYDLSTKVIPAIGLTHEGVYPPLLGLLKDAGVSLGDFPEPVFYDFSRRKHIKVPVFMRQFGKLKILRDFAKACTLFFEIRSSPFVDGVYQSDLIASNESVPAWAKRHGVESFGVFTCYLVDLFNQGPSDRLPVNTVIMSRMHFAAPFLHSLLSKKGVRHYWQLFGSKHPGFQQFLRLKPVPSSYFVVREGYQNFFQRLAAHYALTVRCNSAVSNVRKTAQGLEFSINGEQAVTYDAVVFCCPPPAIAQMSYLPEVKDILQQVRVGRKIRTWAFEASGWDEKTFGRRAIVIDGTNHLGLSTPEMKINGEVNYIAKEHADSNLLCSAVYLDADMDETAAIEALRVSLLRFNLTLTNVVTFRDFVWPYHFPLGPSHAGQFEALQQCQGRDNVYYCGESFFGIGVPTLLEYTEKFVEQHFVGRAQPAAPSGKLREAINVG